MLTEDAPISDETPVEESEVETTEVAAETSGGNPAWESLRKELDPISFSRIEPHLRSMDTAGQQRFTKLNDEYKWAKELQSNGTTPDRISAAIQFADSLDSSPETIYEQLGQFLRENGRMPASTQELVENTDDPDEQQDYEQVDDPRFAQITEQNTRIENFLREQEESRAAEAMDAKISGELQQLESARKDLTRPDIGEILTYAAHNNRSIAEATQWFDGLKNRFLSAPRPGDSAPQLLPTSGGVPSAGVQKTAGQMTDAEVQAMIAGAIQSNNGR